MNGRCQFRFMQPCLVMALARSAGGASHQNEKNLAFGLHSATDSVSLGQVTYRSAAVGPPRFSGGPSGEAASYGATGEARTLPRTTAGCN